MINVLYVFHGNKCAEEFGNSIDSIARFNANVKIWAICPQEDAIHSSNVNYIYLSTKDAGSGFQYKVHGICNFDESEFIFLDTDTYMIEWPIALESALRLAGIAGVPDPLYCTFRAIPDLIRPKSWSLKPIPFGEVNSGVLCINKSILPSNFFEDWIRRHYELIQSNKHIAIKYIPDQPSLLEAINQLNVCPLMLGSELNYRACYPQLLNQDVKIIHAHMDSGAAFCRKPPSINGDLSIAFPWGLIIRRRGIPNRFLYAVHRYISIWKNISG